MVTVVALAPDAHNSGRSVDTLSQLAQHASQLVVVAPWAASLLRARLERRLQRHRVALVATRLSRQATGRPVITNTPAIRRLVEDGALVVCLAGGPGRDDTASLAPRLARRLGASILLRLDGDGATKPMPR